jgi:hypothetical protein
MRSQDVDPKKCPRLHAALVRQEERAAAEWKRVEELKRKGKDGSAKRLVRKILGVKKGPPMDQETKEYLAHHKAEHAEEIKEREKQEKEVRARTIALLTTGKKGRSKA